MKSIKSAKPGTRKATPHVTAPPKPKAAKAASKVTPKATANLATASVSKKAASRKAPQTGSAPQVENHQEKIEIRIPADPRWVRSVRLAAAGVASGLRFSIDEIDDIKLAVSEACNNAILHARLPEGVRGRLPIVTITFIPALDHLKILVEDEGRTTTQPQTPVPSGDSLPEGGLGLLVIQTVMDEVGHNIGLEANTVLSMVKYARAAA